MPKSVFMSESPVEAHTPEQTKTEQQNSSHPEQNSPSPSESSASDLLATEFAPTSQLKLVASIRFSSDHLVLSQRGIEFPFQCDSAIAPQLQRLLLMLDGRRSLADLQALFPGEAWDAIADILNTLNAQGLLDDVEPISQDIEASFAQALIQQIQQQLETKLQNNQLWRSLTTIQEPPSPDLASPSVSHSQLSPQVLYGLALELYYYLDQASAFRSPLKDFQSSVRLRRCFDKLCRTEQEQRKALSQSLEAIGLEEEAIAQHLPLAETAALVNGMAFWSQSEPEFALLLQVILGQTFVRLIDMFRLACGSAEAEPGFAESIAQAAVLASGLKGDLEHFRLACTSELVLTSITQSHYANQGYLFTELYDHWLAGIQRDYSNAPQLQRSINALVGNHISVERPRLKDGVLLKFCDAVLEVQDQKQGIAIALTSEEKPEMEQLLRCLQAGGFSQAELAQTAPSLAEQIGELLQAFHAQGWLTTEAENRPLSGPQFYRELERFLARLKQQLPPSPMLQRMIDGEITREQLIGYSLESYHVTSLCPRLLAPALSQWESRATQTMLHDFFTSELHHDQLVENSLKAVGFSLDQIRTMQPLPMTFAVCSSLGTFARRHPLTFKSALMMFEEDDKIFHQLFEQRCQDLDLPSSFYCPILLHAHINEDGEHDQITKWLLEEVAYISVEEQQLVKRNLAVLLMSMVLRTHEILDYYGDVNHAIPRCFQF